MDDTGTGHELLKALFGQTDLYAVHLAYTKGGQVLEHRFLDELACDDIVLLMNETIE